jgi:BMFP domain-containing protein YqiC
LGDAQRQAAPYIDGSGLTGAGQMQSENGFMDQVARLMTNAAGAAKGMRDEIATMAKTRAEKLANDLELVPREEFEAMKAVAMKARAEVEALRARVETLEKQGAAQIAPRFERRIESLNRKTAKPVQKRRR